MKEFVSLLPMVDELCVLEMDTDQLVRALENGVSQYPRLEGRFPQVSGVSFSFDASQPAGSRVVRDSVQVGGKPLGEKPSYTVCVKAYLALGKDGYDVFKECKVVLDSEAAPVLPTLVRNYFTHFGVLNGYRDPTATPAASTAQKQADKVARRPSTSQQPGEEGKLDYVVSPQIEGRIVCCAGAVEV